MPSVVILGSNGQLGAELAKEFSTESVVLAPLARRDLDILDYPAVSNLLASIRPDTVINATAFHKLEACEDEPEKAFAVNCHAVRHLARVCEGLGAQFVHVSTDYVFGGDQRSPYLEDAALRPLNVYGVSKAAGEYFVRSTCSRYTIIRTSGLFGLGGASGKGGNFVETMLRLGKERGTVSVVTDQITSPTHAGDLAQTIKLLAGLRAQGVFHVTNSGSCSWYDFAKAIFESQGAEGDAQPTTTEAFGATVARPAYSVLGEERLREEGIAPLRPWAKALEAYMASREKRSVDVG